MTLRRFVEVPSADWPQAGQATVIELAGVDVALFNVDGRFFAISDFCIRCGASLATGVVSHANVSCSCCGWTYELASGRLLSVPGLGVETFEVEMLPSRLLVALNPSSTD